MRALAAAVALCLCAEGAVAQSEGLRRLTDRADLLGWEAVGRLDTAEGGYCTATLIAPDQVLTAAHCVFDGTTPRRAEDLTFRAGLSDGTAIAERKISAIAASPGYRPETGHTFGNITHDVALLLLSAPITSAEADPFVLHQGSLRGTRISVTSYGKGRDAAPSRQRDCRVVGERAPILAFDCNVTFGSSGAPVFILHGERGRIVSIISGGGTFAGERVAYGMMLPDIVADLKRDLRSLGARPTTARIRRLGVGDARSATGAKFVRPDGS